MKKENIIKFYLNFRLYIFPVAVSISSLLLIVFVIYPQSIKLITNQRVHQDLSEKSKFLEVKASTLESLDEEDLSRKIEYALLAYPADRDFGNIVGLLQTVSNQNGFSIVTLSVRGDPQTSGDAQKYSVKLESLGPENLLPRFIAAIESSIRIMKISSIEISSSREGGIINTALEVDVFYAEAPKSFGGPDSPLPQLSNKDEQIIATIATSTASRLPQILTPQPRGKLDPFE